MSPAKPLQGRLQSRIVIALVLSAVCASAVMLLLIGMAWRHMLQTQRAEVAAQTSRLLQATLENAMLKRDVPGLQQVVQRLGQQPGVVGVYIVNRQGEIRFSSRPEALGEVLPGGPDQWAHPSNFSVQTESLNDRHGTAVVRAINPVQNQLPCLMCHGSAETHPINGTLLVDFDAAPITAQTWQGMVEVMLAGALVVGVMAWVVGWMLRRRVIQPLEELEQTVQGFDAGQEDLRAPLSGGAEVARVAEAFNHTADRLMASRAEVDRERLRLQLIVDSLPDAVRVLDASGRMRAANKAFCERYGVTPETLAERPCYAITHGLTQPCVPTMVLCPLHELNEHRLQMRCNQRHLKADGTLFPVEIHAARFTVPGEAQAWIVESIRDLSAAASVSQEERLAEVGLLAAGVAHEIHNPLASVRLAVQMLQQEIAAGRSTDREMEEYLQLVDREVDQCIHVTQRLLLLARKPTGALQAVDIVSAVQDTLGLLAFDALQHHIIQVAHLPDIATWVLAEVSELRMLLINLIQNAHHAMPDGGDLTIHLSTKQDRHCLRVTDTGVGISPEDLPHIFDPFFTRRADGHAGTGLGLTICRGIVEGYGGSIRVHSQLGVGTTFEIELPAYTGSEWNATNES